MPDVQRVHQPATLVAREEGHFFDFKAKEVAAGKLTGFEP
jgi:hypothetical protein